MSDSRASILRDARRHLTDPVFEHSLSVAECAENLAGRYGVDAYSAWVAGILHDWDKALADEDVLTRAQDFGLPVLPEDIANPYLLHARTGAQAVKGLFREVTEEIAVAIERHTLGDADMRPLDMVLYVADMIEPGRRFPGVDVLRESVATVSLRELFALCYQHSVEHLVRARRPVHPLTVEVWNSLIARERLV